MSYGMPYKGSKSSIARDICAFLPEGNRFVDLFGGGGAITHCAMNMYKWESFLYNELNPLVANLFKDCVTGRFNPSLFKPHWISREEFNEKKGVDGYVALCWSFSNNGKDYLFSKEIEDMKHSIFEWVVNNKKDSFIQKIFPYETLESDNLTERRLEYMTIAKHLDSTVPIRLDRMESLESMERLKRLQNLENLEMIDSLEITNQSYEQYQHRGGDIVYCDIPYEGTNCGSYNGFDHKTFYDWAYTRDYQVFFSSYGNISDKRFIRVWEQKKQVLCCASTKALVNIECIYSNMPYKKNLLAEQLEFDF